MKPENAWLSGMGVKHVMKGHDLLPGTSTFTFITFISGHKQAIISYTCHNRVIYVFEHKRTFHTCHLWVITCSQLVSNWQ